MKSSLQFVKQCSLGLALGALLCLTGAAQTPPSSLTVAAFPAVDEVVRAATAQWKRIHPDVEIKIVSRQFADHHTAMTTALSTSFYLPDVMALEKGYLGRFSQGGGLEVLSQAPYQAQFLTNRWVPYAVAQATNKAGQLIGIPTDIGPGTLLYRSDLLEKTGLTEVHLTQSWDSYLAAGVKIKTNTGAYLLPHARDIKDIVIRSGIQLGDGLYYDKNSKAQVNTPRFARAFELAKKVRDLKLDARVDMWSNEWAEGLRRGRIATEMSGAWLSGHLSNWIAADTKGLWRAAQLPENTWAAYGGTFYAIPKGAPPAHKVMAWELIQLLTNNRDTQLAAFKSQNAFPALIETYGDPFFEEPIAFLGGQPARTLWREAARHIQAVSVHKQDAFAEEVINTELDMVLDKGKNIRAALADAQRLIDYRAYR
jgi:multiple sugar transport system substrate-binding protein